MPTIDTPFVMELHPGEELKLARIPTAGDDTSANAFAKNDFQAWVSNIVFAEEVEAEADPTAAAKPAHNHKHSVIRVSLIAHLLPQAGSKADRKRDRDDVAAPSDAFSMKTVTLASCNFGANLGVSGGDASASSTAGTLLESSVVFRSPLAFHSAGSIQHLSVVAEDMATTAGSSSSSGSVKRYQGERRFTVRLHGLQQTSLTQEQVVLLAK